VYNVMLLIIGGDVNVIRLSEYKSLSRLKDEQLSSGHWR